MLKTTYTRLIGALLVLAALLAGCATGAAPTTAPTTESAPTQGPSETQSNNQNAAYPPPTSGESTAYPLVEETPTAYPSPQQ
ncbi:MAG TPA: hypothetical protein VFT66_24985 [Roseiflexaceae bacterium]|jgi:ABC-type phosphate transport system substrate-binding protein|nr:hypothetical protein [Roseiflexaceae bacterium]